MLTKITRCFVGLTLGSFVLLSSASAANTVPPTITANNQTAQCIYPTVQVWINPTVVSNWDPLPLVTYQNRLSSDPNAYPSNSDPDQYPFGMRNVTIKACDHNTPTANCSTKTITVNSQDTLAPVVSPGRNLKVQCTGPTGVPGYVSTTGTPYCADTCNNQCPACLNPNTASTGACTSCSGPCLSSCLGNPAWVALYKPTVQDICDPNASWTANVPPATYPIGNTSLSVTGYDFSGNTATQSILVQVVDTVPPVFTNSEPAFNVLQNAGSCNNGGTNVTLPHPNATDLCTTSTGLKFSWTVPSAFSQELTGGTVCLPGVASNTPYTVNYLVRDASGNLASTPSTITVLTTSPLTLAITQTPSGFVSAVPPASTPTLAVNASNASGAVNWTVVGARPPDTQTSPTPASLRATFVSEGNFCPLYVSGVDSGSTPKPGAVLPVCFVVDNTPPTQTYTAVPPTSSWPNNGTPLFSSGTPLPLQITAQDTAGYLPSGVAEVSASLVNNANVATLVYDNTFCTNSNAVNGALPSCPQQEYVGGCNQNTPLCRCVVNGVLNVDSTNSCKGDGRLNLSGLPSGQYSMKISVRDLANNVTTQYYPFAVGDLQTAYTNPSNPNAGLVAMLTQVLNNPTTPSAAYINLQTAIQYVTAASAMFYVSPGQSFVLSQAAWAQLDQARSNGANLAFYETFLANTVEGEVRRVLVQTQQDANTNNWQTWAILGDPNTEVNHQYGYETRRFLVDRGGTFRDYAVNPNTTLNLAQGYMNVADQYLTNGQSSSAMASALSAFNTLSTLFRDQTYASLYGSTNYPLHSVSTYNGTVPEGFFMESPAGHYGAEVAASVNAQIGRYVTAANGGALTGISASTIATLNSIQQNLALFTAGVQQVQSPNGLTNYAIVHNVYLPAVTALQQMATVQGASIYTRGWQTGLSYTLADIVNYSMYAGQTALACILWGSDTDGQSDPFYSGCGARSKVANAPRLLGPLGTPQGGSMDWEAQTAECRYNRMMYALGDGRLTQTDGQGAVDLFVASQCLIVDLYNNYYTPGTYVSTDTAITYPSGSGCVLKTYLQADAAAACGTCALGGTYSVNGGNDTVCNGIDDTCSGAVDSGVAPSTCGCGSLPAAECPCAASSACINGQAVPCVPGTPPYALDTLCNGKDNNCNGTLAENWLPTSCGVGGCTSYSTCTNGSMTACVPKTSSSEVCDHVDNNCNILVDEGLDNDQDGYGCPPCTTYNQTQCNAQEGCTWSSSGCAGIVQCVQCTPGSPNCTTSLLCSNDKASNGNWTGKWDCNDNDPTIFPGDPEVCDGKDNNCNLLIDEGVTNACGNCDPSCLATTIGNPGSPFTPNPVNSQNISQNPNNGNIGLTTQNINAQFAWVSNDTAGTVSKIDTVTGREVARYCQALKTGVTTFYRSGGTDPTGATYDTRAEPSVCAECGGCNRGSRTAVDQSGNVFIANRAHEPTPYQGTYTKIASTVGSCIDVNGDGIIETSSDVNGDGVINPNTGLPATSREYWAGQDECILWTRKPTTWDGNVTQPSCNTPGWPADPCTTSYTAAQTTCTHDPNSTSGVCLWTNGCTGTGDPGCSAYSTTSSTICNGAPNLFGHYCTWAQSCTGSNTSCASQTTQLNCQSLGCTWTQACNATACTTWNSNKTTCNKVNTANQGCTWFESCYNVGAPNLAYPTLGPIIPRACAIDKGGNVWVGLYGAYGFMEINPTNGFVKRWIYSGYSPYGVAIDKNGILWFPNGCCGNQNLGSINTNPNTIVYTNPDNGNTTFTWTGYQTQKHTTSPNGSYGIAVDGAGHVFVGSYPSLTAAANRFDTQRNSWTQIPVSANPNGTRLVDAGIGRGLTVDTTGTIWVAQHGDGGGRITAFNPNTLLPTLDDWLYGGKCTSVAMPGTNPSVSVYNCGVTPIGVGVGYGGKIWTNNQGSSNVAVVDPVSGAFEFFPVGGPPYTYSDFTGSILRAFTAPQGTYDQIINACYGFQVNAWVNMIWQGNTPIGTQNQGKATSLTAINMRMRGANALTTVDNNGNSVNPLTATTWSLWFPDDINDPSKNPSDPNRVYYWKMAPSSQWPTTGPCAGQQSNTYVASTNSYNTQACSILSAVPTTYTWNASYPNQPILYVDVQAQLVADGDDTVQPTLVNFQVARTCPQL